MPYIYIDVSKSSSGLTYTIVTCLNSLGGSNALPGGCHDNLTSNLDYISIIVTTSMLKFNQKNGCHQFSDYLVFLAHSADSVGVQALTFENLS